jgi:hypothetical protein
MNMCQEHWDRLREKINQRGLSHLIAPDGQTAAAQLADQFQRSAEDRDESTVANFDPLMGAFMAIGSNIMGLLGQSALYLMSGGPDALEDPIDFAQYANGDAVRGRLALFGLPLTWPRCGLCYAGLAHELTCTEQWCTLPKVDGYAWMLDRAADDAKARALELGLLKAGGDA